MFKFILAVAILGGIGYFAFQKFSQDNATGSTFTSTVGQREGSTAAERAIRAVTNENYDYENK